MHFGLLREPVEDPERLGVSRVLGAQFFNTPLHGRVEEVPPGLVGQQLRQVERLSTHAAAEVEHGGRARQAAAEVERLEAGPGKTRGAA